MLLLTFGLFSQHLLNVTIHGRVKNTELILWCSRKPTRTNKEHKSCWHTVLGQKTLSTDWQPLDIYWILSVPPVKGGCSYFVIKSHRSRYQEYCALQTSMPGDLGQTQTRCCPWTPIWSWWCQISHPPLRRLCCLNGCHQVTESKCPNSLSLSQVWRPSPRS